MLVFRTNWHSVKIQAKLDAPVEIWVCKPRNILLLQQWEIPRLSRMAATRSQTAARKDRLHPPSQGSPPSTFKLFLSFDTGADLEVDNSQVFSFCWHFATGGRHDLLRPPANFGRQMHQNCTEQRLVLVRGLFLGLRGMQATRRVEGSRNVCLKSVSGS